LNRYAYVLNNPIIYNDRSGNIPVLAVVGLAAVGVGALIGGVAAGYNSYKETGHVSGKKVLKGAAIGGAIGGGAVLGAAAPKVLSAVTVGLYTYGPQLNNFINNYGDDVFDFVVDIVSFDGDYKRLGKNMAYSFAFGMATKGTYKKNSKAKLKPKSMPKYCSVENIEVQKSNYNSGVIELPSKKGSIKPEDNINALKNSRTSQKGLTKGEGNAKTRLPRTEGNWQGEPGNGKWFSDKSEVNNITGGNPVEFTNGRPNFTPWLKGSLKFKEGQLNGTQADFDLVYGKIKDIRGLNSKNQAKEWLSQKGLTPHHKSNTEIELIPTDLHKNVPHIGSASDLRGGN
ncbi:HNH endonuclease, partial [Clostridium polynesiense]|uniref:HNH endonuclease n=1 Tax=Clostridium polynesiense TaxID=1325933 RepID=UPI00164E65C1